MSAHENSPHADTSPDATDQHLRPWVAPTLRKVDLDLTAGPSVKNPNPTEGGDFSFGPS